MVPNDAEKDENPWQALKDRIHILPEQPGVYLFKDSKGNLLYIGKANNLLKRVKSHFSSLALSPKDRQLISRTTDIDFLITDSETEALILECSLIKKYRPKYNIRLKDDKTYPYLKIELNQPYPTVSFTRRRQTDGARYFGPFSSARSLRLTLDTLRKLFPFRSCDKKIIPGETKDNRPCLEYDLGRCLGPCLGAVDQDRYLKTIDQVISFLEGKTEEVKRQLEQEMNQLAERLEFEKAAKIRDRLLALQKITEGKKIATDKNIDVISLALSHSLGAAQVFFIRGGKLMGREVFFLEGVDGERPQDIMSSFVKQFYHLSTDIPDLLLLQHPVEDLKVILSWLRSRKKGNVDIEVPTEGENEKLLSLCTKNAQEALEQYRLKKLSSSQLLSKALVELKEKLSLSSLPRKIECYDISDIQGEYAVGSLVVFEDGKPKPAHYRRFRVKMTSRIDDAAMLAEVLSRRLRRLCQKEASWEIPPDLILVDGGKQQLNSALKVIERFNQQIPLIALAKEREEIYLPKLPHPIKLPLSSPGLNLLRLVRDEAHRFALGYHLKVGERKTFASPLDEIPGIGPQRKKLLLKRFGSLNNIKKAPLNELSPLIGKKLAEKLKEML